MAKKRRVKKVVEEEDVKKAPVGVQIISVLYYISAVLCVVAGLLFIIGANALVSILVSSAPEFENLSSVVFVVMGIVLMGLGVLGFFVGRGLWKLKQWARMFAIVFATLGVISAIYSMITNFAFGNIISILIHGTIGYYLLLSKEAKRAFK